MNPSDEIFQEAKMTLLSAQSLNANDWYGTQFQKGLDEISRINYRKPDMRTIPLIILSLSEVSMMMNENNKEKIIDIQNKLWKYHIIE